MPKLKTVKRSRKSPKKSVLRSRKVTKYHVNGELPELIRKLEEVKEVYKQLFLEMTTMQKIIKFIQDTCVLFDIDDSHGLDHSIKTLLWSLKIGKDVNLTYYELQVIQLSCLLHDMCDKKYMNETYGVQRIRIFLTETMKIDDGIIDRVIFIIKTMSYSKVIKDGYPDFKKDKSLEKCYHIVRNSDLLESYDPERCIAYNVRCGGTRKDNIIIMFEIFKKRELLLLENGYINIEPAKEYAMILHREALVKLKKYRLEILTRFNL